MATRTDEKLTFSREKSSQDSVLPPRDSKEQEPLPPYNQDPPQDYQQAPPQPYQQGPPQQYQQGPPQPYQQGQPQPYQQGQPQPYQQNPSQPYYPQGPPQAYSQQGPGPHVVYAQPQATVVTQSTTPKKMPQNRRDWNAGLCGCLGNIGTCCFATCCCPCFDCAVATQLGENPCGPLCCCCLFEVAMRTKVRTMYGISGSICCDTLTMCCCWCHCCAMIQMKREMDLSANDN